MRLRSVLAIALSVCAFGCGGGCSGAGDERTAAERERSGESAAGAASGSEGRDPEEMPPIRLAGEVERHGRTVAILIENHGTEQASVRGALDIQKRHGNDWEDFGADVDLRFDCDARAPECAELAPGAVLIPPQWLGTAGDAQCACERCARAPAGTYRFVARSCGGTHTIEGEPFELP